MDKYESKRDGEILLDTCWGIILLRGRTRKANKQALNTKPMKVHLELLQISNNYEHTFVLHARIRHKK